MHYFHLFPILSAQLRSQLFYNEHSWHFQQMMLLKPRVLFNYPRFMNVKVQMYPGFVKERSTFRFQVFPLWHVHMLCSNKTQKQQDSLLPTFVFNKKNMAEGYFWWQCQDVWRSIYLPKRFSDTAGATHEQMFVLSTIWYNMSFKRCESFLLVSWKFFLRCIV